MKKLEELGISPAPWSGNFCGRVEDADGEFVANSNNTCVGQFVAEAPKLYEFLREAVIETCHNFECCGPYPEYACNGSKDCFVKRWRAALAKATGEAVAE